jgi:hypothetical protein
MKMTFVLTAGASLLVGCSTGPSPDLPTDWNDRTASTSAHGLVWTGIAADATATRIVATASSNGAFPSNPGIWTSTDSGASWTDRTPPTTAAEHWSGVASDATGTHLVAVADTNEQLSAQDVWTSANAGATWTKRASMTSTSKLLESALVVSDTTGAHLVVADGDIWTSSDSGVTWIDQTVAALGTPESWVGLASDASGQRLVGATAYGDVWTSSDFGVTWTNRTTGTAATGQQWAGVASDATGARLVAVAQGSIWTSTDGGAAWVERSVSEHNWVAVASDTTGLRLVAATAHEGIGSGANDLWTSDDGGATWADATAGTLGAGQEWAGLAVDATATHVAAISVDPGAAGICCFGDIWTN